MDFVLGFQQHFLFPAFAAADGIVDQTGGFRLRRADFPLCDLLAVNHTAAESAQNAHQGANDDQNQIQQFHKFAAHLLLNKNWAKKGWAMVSP